MHKFFFCFLLWLIPFALSAQRTISGRITDADDGKPIPGAVVFIANTSVGTTTEADGKYRLQIPSAGSYRLTVSHVGFQPVFRDIEPGKTPKMLNIKLKVHELDEVTVTATVRTRKRDIDLFWKTILGKEPSPKTIYAKNPEAAFFYYNSKTRILTVISREPLQIINNETGYLVKYVLDEFKHDYNTGISSWDGECQFVELEPENDRQTNIWEKNRAKIHSVSINYFIKALYHNSLMENGFLLTDPGDENLYNIHPLAPLRELYVANIENILSFDPTDSYKTLHIPDFSHLLLVCFGKPITNKDLGNVRFAQNGKSKWDGIGLFRCLLEIPNGKVQIFPDGTYLNRIQWSSVFTSKSLTGLDMKLPIDQLPDIIYGIPPVVTANDSVKVSQAVISRPTHPLIDSLNNTAKRFGFQLSVFPQEKVHLHIDKPYYISGERIWFRAHVVDAASHVPVSDVNCVYVELFDVRDSVVSRVKTGFENNTFNGYIPIPPDIPEGYYTIRAYTNRMRSLEEDSLLSGYKSNNFSCLTSIVLVAL